MATTPASTADPTVTTPAAAGATGRPSLAEIIAAQEEIFVQRQPESARLAGVATGALAGGVVSSWQISRPAAGVAEPRPGLQAVRR